MDFPVIFSLGLFGFIGFLIGYAVGFHRAVRRIMTRRTS